MALSIRAPEPIYGLFWRLRVLFVRGWSANVLSRGTQVARKLIHQHERERYAGLEGIVFQH